MASNTAQPGIHSAASGGGSSETSSPATYVGIFIALLVLLAITVVLAFQDVPEQSPWRDVLTMTGYTIAILKTLLIVMWFMHVKQGARLTWLFSAAAFVWLGIMMVLTLTDYKTRDDLRHANAPAALKMAAEEGAPQEARPPGPTRATAYH